MFEYLFCNFGMTMPLSRCRSLLGEPALSLPLFTVSGLAVGLQVLGFGDDDAGVIRV